MSLLGAVKSSYVNVEVPFVGHHYGGHIFGKMNLLHLHSESRGSLALFCTLYRISIYVKPMLAKMLEFQCEILICPEYQRSPNPKLGHL